MADEKISMPVPVVVEGKYDKIKLSQVIDGHIITTDGFGIFNKKEKAALIRRLAEPRGIAVLTDSDRGGRQIRSYLASILPGDKIYDLHIPKIEGKERRKKSPSAAGTLGVEGMDDALLYEIFLGFIKRLGADSDGIVGERREITKAMLFEWGLTGAGSAEGRDMICRELGLPDGMNATAFMGALNVLLTADEFEAIAERVFSERGVE
ncbi:MAG: DUF4093 domain-containing protein [Ruminococcaceae bacterium]|nr:DUF4093 domain-containing protein [Oscillospiraceae bacterium]